MAEISAAKRKTEVNKKQREQLNLVNKIAGLINKAEERQKGLQLLHKLKHHCSRIITRKLIH